MSNGAMMENVMELAKQGGSLGGQNLYTIMQSLIRGNFNTKKYKEAFGLEQEKFGESKRQWQSDFDRQKELDKLREELDRSTLALNQATSSRADTSAEMGRIGTYYPSATPGARQETRQDLISRGLLPESLLQETIVNPNKDTSRDSYPAAQSALYGNETTRGISTPQTRIVNAPAGTQVNPMQDAYLNLALLKQLMDMGKSTTPRTKNIMRGGSISMGADAPNNPTPGQLYSRTWS
uniref:Uncharacterized protein n=1 Tax=viral metagenome TaxID=1070528 RepID=A0A6M3KSY3_9ZZZZ